MKKKIYVRLSSGLGNQLFMFATFKYFSSKKTHDVYFDSQFFNRDKQRTPELSIFFENNQIPTNNVLFNPFIHGGIYRKLALLFHRLISRLNIVSGEDVFNAFDDIYVDSNYYFDSYFQNSAFVQKYFDPASLVPIEEPPFSIREYEKLIKSSKKAVAIHVRRGDFFSPENIDRYGVCDKDYFCRSIEFIKNNLGIDCTFFIFTDDENWVSENFSDLNVQFKIVPAFKVNSFWHIYLMSKAHSNIISNSTFSWWGAFLNTNPSKIVVGPKQWLKGSTETLVLPNWKKI